MLRKLLLPFLATAALAGCATDYNYRNGNGDYYYGTPRVEYRNQGAGGYYGDFGYGFGGDYYYDRFGRLVYGAPGGYFGFPYYGGNDWYRPRRNRGHGDHDNDDHDGDGRGPHHGNDDHQDRPPPWRDLGGLQQRQENGDRDRGDRQRPTRPMPSFDAPIRQQRVESREPVTRQRSESPSRMSGSSGGEARSHGKRDPLP